MRLPHKRARRLEQVYSEQLERWVEIAVFDEEYLMEAVVAKIDLTDKEIADYVYEVLRFWPGLGTDIRLELSTNVEAQKELYDMIIKLNPILHPSSIIQVQELGDMSEEHLARMEWFSSQGKSGKRPAIGTN